MDNYILSSEDLGKIVHEARKAQGLSQTDLAGLTGTGRRFISELEQGKGTSEIGKILSVLAALGVALYSSTKWKQ